MEYGIYSWVEQNKLGSLLEELKMCERGELFGGV